MESEVNLEVTPFARGTGNWEGVVMVIRPDPSKMRQGDDPLCRVISARTIQFAGRRAISERLPYSFLRHFFRSEDTDHCFVEAEFFCDDKDGGHLEFYCRSPLSFGAWVEYSMTQEQQRAVIAADKKAAMN